MAWLRSSGELAYRVEFDSRASKDLEKLSRDVAQAVVQKCSTLGENPLEGPGIKRLSVNLYRLEVLRVWRVVYLVEGTTVGVVLVGHRRDCYHRLRRRL